MLDIRVGEGTITGTGALPATTELISPSDGATFGPLDPIEVQWTSPADAARFFVVATPTSGPALELIAEGTARTLTIEPGVLPEGQPIRLEVVGHGRGALTGQVTTGSVMDIRGVGIPATIQITP